MDVWKRLKEIIWSLVRSIFITFVCSENAKTCESTSVFYFSVQAQHWEQWTIMGIFYNPQKFWFWEMFTVLVPNRITFE